MSSPGAERRPDLVQVGRITGCFGIRGYLKVDLSGKSSERATKLRRVYVGRAADTAEEFTVADVKLEGGKVLILLRGVEDRSAAEKVRGTMLFVEPSDAAPPERGGYYVHEIIGCRVRTAEGTSVGVVEDVLQTPGGHLWAVRNGEAVHHIPAVKEFIVSVDTGKKEIIVSLPEGLTGEQ